MIAEAWHRRHAIQIAAALPEQIDDALVVLALAQELVSGFLAGTPAVLLQRAEPALARDLGNVVSLSSATNGINR